MPNADLEPKSFELTIEEDGGLSARLSDDWTAEERKNILIRLLDMTPEEREAIRKEAIHSGAKQFDSFLLPSVFDGILEELGL